MWRAIQKYGFENFKHEILEDGLTEETAKAREIALIAECRTTEYDFGYNGTDGGDGMRGYIKSPEQIERHRQKMMGHPVSEETRAKLREARKGYIMPSHVLEAAHAASRGRKQSPDEIEKRRAKLIGRKMSEEFKQNMRKRMSGQNNPSFGKKQTPEHIARRVAGRAGYRHSEETKEKIRQSRIGDKNPMRHRDSFYNQRKIAQYDLSGNLVAEFVSINEAVRVTGNHQSCISGCRTGKRQTTGGYKWKYV